nr:bifunctional solanapyrone synthase [Quercus suber]
MIQVAAVENARAFKDYLEMPAAMDSTKMTTVRGIVTEYDPAPSGYYNFFYTISVKNDVRIFRKAAELHEQVVEDLKILIPDGNFLTECLFQPLPRHYGQKSAENGIGNVMGVSNQPDDGVLFVAIVVVQTAEQEKFAFPKGRAWGEAVKDYAASIENGLLPWVYMNYADKSQDPLRSYGAENVQKIKDVAARYDPHQVFQKLCPGGFKISDVRI